VILCAGLALLIVGFHMYDFQEIDARMMCGLQRHGGVRSLFKGLRPERFFANPVTTLQMRSLS
jgi:hypothetical protein